MYKLFVVFVALLAVALAEPEAKPQLPAVYGYGMNPYHHPVAPLNYGVHPEVKSHLPAAYGVHPYHHSVAPFNYGLHPHGDVLKHYTTFHGAYPYNKFDAYHHPAQYFGAHGIHAHPLHHEAYTAGYPHHVGAFHHPYNTALVQPKY